MKYRLAQRFVRIEAIGTPDARSGEVADPLSLQVAVTPADNIQQVVQHAIAGPSTRDVLWRAGLGHWIFQLDPRLYEPGKTYVAHYRFAMTPNNTKVVRQTFTWEPVPVQPHDPENVVVFGEMLDGIGLPVSGGRVVVEQYDDVIALTKRKTAVDVIADAFGLWHVELPRNAIVRFVTGNDIVIRTTPSDQASVAFTDLAEFQPASTVRKDRYGYPYPA